MPCPTTPLRAPLALLLLLALPPLATPGPAAAQTSLSLPGRQPGELERVQMHRNGLRGVHYLSTRLDGAADGPEPAQVALRPIRNIDLDGDPRLNVRGGAYPIDVNGNGTFALLHFNGYRLMRLYGVEGRKLWQVDNPSGRVHRDNSHRDTLAVFDADGDGGQDIVHCWSDPGAGTKSLMLRDGKTGRVLKQVQLAGQGASAECQIAAFRVAGQAQPLVLVAAKAASADCVKGNYTPYYSKTFAYRGDLTLLWELTTCAAGHYAWPLDTNHDGRAEAVFVGKYLLRPDGTTQCVLPIGVDHVDSMVVADLDRGRAGLEALTVGTSGTRMFSAGGCTLRWTIPPGTIANPQQTGAAFLDPDARAPNLLVTNKLNPSETGYELRPLKGTTVDAAGRILGTYVDDSIMIAPPLQNANLDGAPAVEDRVVGFGQVVDGDGRRRLDTSWYWDLQQLTPEEEALDPREQWSRNPFAFDLDDDGRDELVVWGRRKLVVGTLDAPGDPGDDAEVDDGTGGDPVDGVVEDDGTGGDPGDGVVEDGGTPGDPGEGIVEDGGTPGDPGEGVVEDGGTPGDPGDGVVGDDRPPRKPRAERKEYIKFKDFRIAWDETMNTSGNFMARRLAWFRANAEAAEAAKKRAAKRGSRFQRGQ